LEADKNEAVVFSRHLTFDTSQTSYLSANETLGTDLLKSKYKAISNLVRSQTRKDTAGHVANLSKSYFANSKKFWNFLNSIKGRCHPIPPLKHNDSIISDDSEKSQNF